MSDARTGNVGIDERGSERRKAVATVSSDPPAPPSSDELPPFSDLVPSSPLPRPPAQVVAALTEFEEAGPESFRKSFPEIAAKLSPPPAPLQSRAPISAAPSIADVGGARVTKLIIAGAVAGAAAVISIAWALLSQ
jgi:hypothetical protein